MSLPKLTTGFALRAPALSIGPGGYKDFLSSNSKSKLSASLHRHRQGTILITGKTGLQKSCTKYDTVPALNLDDLQRQAIESSNTNAFTYHYLLKVSCSDFSMQAMRKASHSTVFLRCHSFITHNSCSLHKNLPCAWY